MTRPDRPSRSASRIIGVLDAGSFKTVCLIASLGSDGRPARIAGVGHVPSAGIRSGAILDLTAAEHAIRAAIAEAERMAGVRLTEVDVVVNCGRVASQAFQASTAVASGVVDGTHLDKLATAAHGYAERGGRRLLELSAWGYRLDDGQATREPLGLEAHRLSADFHAVTADTPATGNLTHTIARGYLTAGRLVPGPLASARAVTTADERRDGVIVLDIGAGVTGLAAYAGGIPVFVETIPVGGGQITHDIAQALRTPLEEAERIKTLYGTVLFAQSDQHDVFTHAGSGGGEDDEQRTTKADLARIIQTRMAALMHLVRDRLSDAGLSKTTTARIVVCGGSSELPGLVPFAESIFRQPVREGRPRHVSGLPPLVSSAAFAGVVGVLEGRDWSAAEVLPAARGHEQPLGYFGRVGQWLKDGF